MMGQVDSLAGHQKAHEITNSGEFIYKMFCTKTLYTICDKVSKLNQIDDISYYIDLKILLNVGRIGIPLFPSVATTLELLSFLYSYLIQSLSFLYSIYWLYWFSTNFCLMSLATFVGHALTCKLIRISRKMLLLLFSSLIFGRGMSVYVADV